MQPVVSGRIHPELSVGEGRYLSIESHYLYSLLWDPFVLARTGAAPLFRLTDAPLENPREALLFHAHSSEAGDIGLVRDVLQAGGKVVLNNPDAELFDQLPALSKLRKGQALVSLRERWDLGNAAGRIWHYADRQPFLRLDGRAGTVLSKIGGNPDLLVLDELALFAGNPFSALLVYRNAAFYRELLLEISTLLARLVAQLLKLPIAPGEERNFAPAGELRRDYHAFGYACLMIEELERCGQPGVVDLTEAKRSALDAAPFVVSGEFERATAGLAAAFRLLEIQNRKLQPTPAVFTDTLHGGGLFEDLGYFEFDWPQHSADVLEEYLHWARTRSYRVNIDFAALSIENMAARFPDLFAQLKESQNAGLLEFVNGSMNQPYPPFHSLESQIRQLDGGNAVFEDVLGERARTYASQEFGFCPQMASVLAGSGYEQVVLRVQNMGDAPTVPEERILWTAPDGDSIRALPSHEYKSEQLNEPTYNNLHLKLHGHALTTDEPAVFSGLGDITYYRPFREELARICHYAPVFGRFETWSSYFAKQLPWEPQPHAFTMEDFDCRAAFLEISKWNAYQCITGNFNSHCMLSMAASHLFAAAEMLDATLAEPADSAAGKVIHDYNWKMLTIYQGHDAYIVPFHIVGVFMGSGGYHHEAVVNDYCGPWDDTRVIDKATDQLDQAMQAAADTIGQRLHQLAPPRPDCDQYVIYNFGPARKELVAIAGAAGKALLHDGQAVATQAVGGDHLALLDLPAYGYCVLVESGEAGSRAAGPPSSVTAGSDFLENELLRAEFDLANGILKRLVRKTDGADLLAGEGHAFYLPGESSQRCLGTTVIASSPLRGTLEFEIELAVSEVRAGRILSRVSLDAGDGLLRFEDEILECPAVKGDQWSNHLGVRFTVGGNDVVWQRSHFNVLEDSRNEQVFSPNLVLARSNSGDVLFTNKGNEFYLRQGHSLSNILIFENEPARKFEYAVGIAGDSPLVQARGYAQPPFMKAVPASEGSSDTLKEGSVSFFTVDSGDIEILSCRREDGQLLLRLANTTGRPVEANLRSGLEVKSAWHTDLRGCNKARLEIAGDAAGLTLRPWAIVQVALVPVAA